MTSEMTSIVSYIPKKNLSREREIQIKSLSVDYTLYHNPRKVLNAIIRRDAKILEVWYPHHIALAIIAFLLGMKIVYSPVICNLEWFYLENKHLKISWRYNLRRLRFLIYDIIIVNMSSLVFVQDRSFEYLWRRINFFSDSNKKIKEVTNNFPEPEPALEAGSKSGDVLLVSHDAYHKIALLELVRDTLTKNNIHWAGVVSIDTMKKYTSISYLGNLDRSALNQYYKKCSVLLQPSIFEGSPRAVYEAMAFNCYVVSWDLLGLRKLKRIFPDYFIKDFSTGPNLNSKKEQMMYHHKMRLWNNISIRRKSYALSQLLTT